MLRRLLYRYGLPAVAIGLLAFTGVTLARQAPRAMATPILPAAMTPFPRTVAAIGLTEPRSEIIEIGTHIPGIVSGLRVAVGQRVKAGDALFSIDGQAATAERDRLARELEVARARLADLEDELKRGERLKPGFSIEESVLARRRFAVRTQAAQVAVAEAALAEAETAIALLTVRAPIDGTVLRVNIRPGEYAADGPGALMVLGDDRVLHVRVEIDERQAHRVRQDAQAVASLRGAPERQIALRFVRFEPQILAKTNLSGSRGELVDTRVLEAIYAFDPAALPAFVGQQMDVFIDAAP
jgi:RND family efflux transporter MFP subunit